MLPPCNWRESRDGLRLSASAEAEPSFEKGSSTASRAVITIEAGSSTILVTDSLPLRAALLFPLYGACFYAYNCSACQPALLLLRPRLRLMLIRCCLLMHGLSHLVLTACVHVGCLLLQEHGGAPEKREKQEWPFPGFSVFTAFHVLRRVHTACCAHETVAPVY